MNTLTWQSARSNCRGNYGATATTKGTGIDFEDKLWAAADKLCGKVGATEYKHVMLVFQFHKRISDGRLACPTYALITARSSATITGTVCHSELYIRPQAKRQMCRRMVGASA